MCRLSLSMDSLARGWGRVAPDEPRHRAWRRPRPPPNRRGLPPATLPLARHMLPPRPCACPHAPADKPMPRGKPPSRIVRGPSSSNGVETLLRHEHLETMRGWPDHQEGAPFLAPPRHGVRRRGARAGECARGRRRSQFHDLVAGSHCVYCARLCSRAYSRRARSSLLMPIVERPYERSRWRSSRRESSASRKGFGTSEAGTRSGPAAAAAGAARAGAVEAAAAGSAAPALALETSPTLEGGGEARRWCEKRRWCRDER